MSNSSNVHDHLGEPTVRRLLDAQAVVRDGLDLVLQIVPFAVERLAPGGTGQAAGVNLDLETAEQEVLDVELVKQRVEPVEEQIVGGVRRQAHVDFAQRADRRRVLDDGGEQRL